VCFIEIDFTVIADVAFESICCEEREEGKDGEDEENAEWI